MRADGAPPVVWVVLVAVVDFAPSQGHTSSVHRGASLGLIGPLWSGDGASLPWVLPVTVLPRSGRRRFRRLRVGGRLLRGGAARGSAPGAGDSLRPCTVT